LEQAEKIAHQEHTTLNAVLNRAIAKGLSQFRSTEEVEQLMEHYRLSVKGLDEEDLLLLEGIILEPVGPDNPPPDQNGW
jgi:hypothetical protein